MNVVLYARVSSDRQDVDLSISAQLKALRKYASDHNYNVIAEFVDEAETSRSSARPEFKKMTSLARHSKKPFEMILVYKFSRFARNREDSIVYKTMLKKKGIQVISITEPFDDTPSGRMLEGIIEVMDEYYSDNLGEEVLRGMRESASRGFYLSARAPYGYRKTKIKDGNKERTVLEIEPSQAAIVKSIFDDVLSGNGLIDIVRSLNNRSIPGPNKKDWIKTSLHAILNNKIYTGTLVWGKNSKHNIEPVVVENAFPSIINEETFNSVRSSLAERAPAFTHPRRVSSRFLLSGIAVCGYCGKAMVGREAKSGKFAYYACSTLDKKGAGSCHSVYLNQEKFESLVIDQIKKCILTDDNLEKMVLLVNEQMDGAYSEYRNELRVISQEEENIVNRLDRLYDILETGDFEINDLGPRIRELRNRQEQLISRRCELEICLSDRKAMVADIKMIKSYVNDLKGILTEGEITERKAFIKSFVNSIIVKKEEAVLNYSVPIPPDGLTENKIGVLPIVHYGGPLWIRTRDPSLIRTVL